MNNHFSCKNCKSVSKVTFSNKVLFCSGLVKKPNPLCDLFRFCICKGKQKSVTDIMIEELAALMVNLSTLYLKYLIKYPTNKNVNK